VPSIHILHLISGLGVGGAERTLQQVVCGLDPARFQSTVVSLGERGVLGDELSAEGVPLRSLGMRPGHPAALDIRRLTELLKELRPDLIQTWMYHADLLGLLAARRAGAPAIVWNVRGSGRTLRQWGISTALVVRACAMLSAWPQAVVVNSEAGRAAHIRLGYRPRSWVLIPNGVDTNRFRPDPNARAQVRSALGISAETLVVGSVGRNHPVKRYAWILRAAAALRTHHPDLAVVLVGEGLASDNRELADLGQSLGIVGRLHLIGPVSEVPRWLAAMDVFVSASASEGFPNAIAEAAACQVPCVVTDAGDSRAIVDQAGVVVGVDDPDGLAAGLQRLAALGAAGRGRLGAQARARVTQAYSREAMLHAYEELYARIGSSLPGAASDSSPQA
jgi:glycosyltransferase involved in cell wall biosynthesis